MKSPSCSPWLFEQNEDNCSVVSLESSVFYNEECVNKNPLNTFIINVGGSRFILSPETLLSYPETRLGKLAMSEQDSVLELCDDANFVDNEYFFDRSSQTFKYIINYYKTGRLHVNEELCAMSFLQEIEYWGIDEFNIDICCRDKYYRRKEINEALDIKQDAELIQNEEEDFSGVICENLRQKLWVMMEKPDSSILAKIFGILSVAFVLISIANMALFSLEYTILEPPLLNAVEYICITWFSAEYLLRFFCVKNKWKFLKSLVNIIDLIAVIPFYITMLVEQLYGGSTELENVGKVVQILRLMRSLRMLKLGRHSTGLKSLGMTVTQCYEEVGLLLLFLSVGISIFSSVEYAVEHSAPETTFSSVPSAWWWATTSMTTVGYGDIRPETTVGKIIAFLCILTGILVLSLPIAIINDRFSSCYFTLKMKDAALRHHDALKRLTKNSAFDSIANVNLRDVYARSIMEMLRIKNRERASTRGSAGGEIW
ncbi:potassium voltage-gated channel subfamily V member 1 [Rhincodon typus]|uniref:potassium voltage-gated channel subfamily V member 1 n=1 Tax=Rhincodon typus TaxID=259920 RepID=UPI00202FD61D|nr:potassium voltage-gated channel subfamily V member 1 [Rhincodon typus]XP_048451942.1 potassium voltage-gated channel subfamily V member 1 [Rhincodon typus]XP_048451943.1 potassium voltage-gated channel subfamily V member 1 [Rhincodon typus]XP_048451944.1 potassium voltage-gated channel subfamily V member 1 [Rhincodon typus]